MKKYLVILLTFILSAHLSLYAQKKMTLDCGTLVEVTPVAYEGYHFVGWADGTNDSIRYIDLQSDTSLIAYFASNCIDYSNWPVIALYDWLLMLNVKEIKEQGFYINENDVTWYRVVDEIDDIDTPEYAKDDILITRGYYLTLDKNLKGTGDYYAEVDIAATSTGEICHDKLRTVIVHYSGTQQHGHIKLLPTLVHGGEDMKLLGILPDEVTQITIYNLAGEKIAQHQSIGQTSLMLRAQELTGCYMLRVQSNSIDQTIKYVVVAY